MLQETINCIVLRIIIIHILHTGDQGAWPGKGEKELLDVSGKRGKVTVQGEVRAGERW